MIVDELIKYVESLAPPGVAWERDNVGLQVGDRKSEIANILLALDLNEKVLEQAISKNCNLIFTHHPLIFNPIKKLDFTKDEKAKLIQKAIQNDIAILSAHTNLDFVKDGVSFELAKTLQLINVDFLLNQKENQVKLVVFVPVKEVENVSSAIFEAGGGIIGEYENCSYRLDGTGTFEGSENSNPAIGKKKNLETVVETRLEVLVDEWKLNSVLSAMIKTHPYEEVAYDIYPLKNENVNYGMGAIGELEKTMSTNEFLEHVNKKLKAKNLRYAKGKSGKIKKVAVCGGSGADMLPIAISKKADAYITADIKYHSFQEAENKILFIDAGHYETEVHVLNYIKKLFEKLLSTKNKKAKVYKYTGSTSPISFYKT